MHLVSKYIREGSGRSLQELPVLKPIRQFIWVCIGAVTRRITWMIVGTVAAVLNDDRWVGALVLSCCEHFPRVVSVEKYVWVSRECVRIFAVGMVYVFPIGAFWLEQVTVANIPHVLNETERFARSRGEGLIPPKKQCLKVYVQSSLLSVSDTDNDTQYIIIQVVLFRETSLFLEQI